MLAYHFVGEKLRDGRDVPPDGEWLVHEGEVSICKSGLHASLEPYDALNYAPGNTICLVEVACIVDEQHDKLVCRLRKIIKRIDIKEHLRRFAADCADSVAYLYNLPNISFDLPPFPPITCEAALAVAARDSSTATDSASAARDAICYAARAAYLASSIAHDYEVDFRNKFNEMIYDLFKE